MKSRLTPILLLLLLALPSLAVELRVVSFNIKANRDMNGNVTEALNDPGTPDHESVCRILSRIDADVVCLQELANADVAGGTGGGTSSDVHSLATSIGLPHVYIPTNAGVFDFTLRNAILSRYPISNPADIGSANYMDSISSIGPPPGDRAKDVTRVMPAVEISVPGVADPVTIINLHAKSASGPANRFRRAVEFRRVEQYMSNNGLDSTDNIIVLGDFNLSQFDDTFTSTPTSGMPGTWNKGTDIPFPVEYYLSPNGYWPTPFMLSSIYKEDLNGGTATFETGSTLDFILTSPALTGLGAEIYRSQLDVDNIDGLTKAGSPLNPTAGVDPFEDDSTTASDHFAVFADYDLVAEVFLTATVSQPSVAETDSAGTATLDITLNRPAGNTDTYTVNLATNAPLEATLSPATLVFGPTDTTLSADIVPQIDGVVDGDTTVTFTATATGLTNATETITVLDVDIHEYVFTGPTEIILENFDGETGTADPLNWVSSPAGNWLGTNDGTAATPGKYAYGTSEQSLGLVTSGTNTFTANYLNNTGGPIRALQIDYDAEHWRVLNGGAADTWSVELIIGGTPTPLGILDFTADTTGTTTPGTAAPRSAIVSNLSISNGTRFQLKFTATAGAGSGTPVDEVFINEFHYDNNSTDTGEFVEIVIAPGFTGDSTDIALYFYNGSGGGTYSPTSLSLSSATLDATVNGYEIHEIFESGIQNGPDGLAVVDTRTDTVLEFISYEGSFMATNGPASGLTSTDIGVSQPTTTPVGEGALGLMGTGSMKNDFTWGVFTGQAHTPGQLNPGQSLVAPGLPAQGIAIDNVSVTLLLDTDDDGDPDIIDTDDDNDGFSDLDEIAAGTDPLDDQDFPGSTPEVAEITNGVIDTVADTLTLTITGAPGVTNWAIEGTTNPSLGFPLDLTPGSIPEGPSGVYTAVIDISTTGDVLLMRATHP